MATIILGIVGGVIGGVVAGPGGALKGAMLGWSIGSTIGGFIDQSRQHYYTPDMGRTADLRVTVASYGTSIPQCWGRTRVPGIITWGTDLVEHETDTSSGGGTSGGPTVTTKVFTYTVSFAVVICKGSANNRVDKIFADDLVIFDRTQAGNTIIPILDSFATQVGESIIPAAFGGVHLRSYYGTETQNADSVIIALAGNTDIPAGADNPAFRGTCYVLFHDMLLTSWGNRIPNLNFEMSTGTTYASNVITDVCTELGIDPATQLDITAISAIPITGLVAASRIDGKSAIQPILDAYHIDLIDVDGKIKAVPRGGATVDTLLWSDLGASTVNSGDAPAVQHVIKSRAGVLTLPKCVDIGYLSTSIDLQQATQEAVRQSAPNAQKISLQYPLSLTDDEARALAERSLYLPWVEQMNYETNAMPSKSNLCAADTVFLQIDSSGNLQRVRIIEIEQALTGGEIRIHAVKDLDAVYTQIITGTTPTGGTPTPSLITTDFFAWSGVELRNQDSLTAGFYVAATGAAGWQGAAILMSVDAGVSYNAVGSVGSRSIFGDVSSSLGSTFVPNGAGFDVTNTTNVTVNGVLNDTSEGDVTNGIGNYGLILSNNTSVSNASDYEILGFADATLVTTNVYTIGDLLRAQRSTLKTGHASSDKFVLLTNSVQRIPVATSLIGTTVLVKVVSVNQDPSLVSPQTVFIATPTNIFATTGGVTSAANAVRTPYWRVRGYQNQPNTVAGGGSSVDETFFPDGAGTAGTNQPGGMSQQYWEESSYSPIDISYYYSSPGEIIAKYLRINLTNPTGSTITFNWWAAVYDNYLSARLNGSYIYNNGSYDASGTATIAAGATVLLEIFYVNHNDHSVGVLDTTNQGTAFFKTDALTQGCTWSDAGK